MIFNHLVTNNTHYTVFAGDKYLVLLFTINAIKKILQDDNLRNSIRQKGLELIDGNGGLRIAKYLSRLQ